ncbi:IniB N-terminal domain-containing protein [Actinomycetospora soli]|uniref:IniB N-terminal domain-containing protein n=1 Tax=Actinomycetospora soli TaxID=2893887 RepID=UPI001E3DA79F|nr:IniB N-terminal domain-containing protein [Actinomycetospora soli]MCD2188612.1 IniB N-terminal domain-containing protein [Actinomycetospora soli]
MTDTAPGAESLLDWMTGLVADPVARARFAADPQHEIDAQGLADLDPADVAHSMPLVTDTVAARFDAVVDLPATPVQLVGESAVDALARHFGVVPSVVDAGAAPVEDDLDDWTETLVDDLAGAPDGLEGVVDAGPGIDLDLDGTGDLDGAHHDHDLDVMTRLDVDHDLDGSHAAVAAAAPTLAFLPGAGAPPPGASTPPDEPVEPDEPVDLHDHAADPSPDHPPEHPAEDELDAHHPLADDHHGLDPDLDVAP